MLSGRCSCPSDVIASIVVAETPFGQLPMLEVDGTVLCQSHAIDRLIAKRLGTYVML